MENAEKETTSREKKVHSFSLSFMPKLKKILFGFASNIAHVLFISFTPVQTRAYASQAHFKIIFFRRKIII